MLVAGPIPGADTAALPGHLSARGLRHIRDRGAIRVGVSFDEPNLAWRTQPHAELQGLEISLAKALAQWTFGCDARNVSSCLELVEMKSADRMQYLKEHAADVVISNFADTPTRRREVSFAGHYLATQFAPLIAPSSPQLSETRDLAGLRIAVVAGTTGQDLLERVAPDAKYQPLATVSDCLDAVATGKAEACWTTTVGNLSYVSSSSGVLRQADVRRGGEHWAMGLAKDSDELERCLNEFISHLVATGRLQQMLHRWLPERY